MFILGTIPNSNVNHFGLSLTHSFPYPLHNPNILVDAIARNNTNIFLFILKSEQAI
jgi:hypothetical protein